MNLAMIGAGYVGLVSAACLADFGHTVICIDQDQRRIEALQKGKLPIFEPGLEALIWNNMGEGRLTFSSDLRSSVGESEVIFIAVGTPSRRGDGHADISFVREAARELALGLKKSALVVMKSTVPVGTSEEVKQIIADLRPDIDFDIASNPEFLREGAAIEDFKRPDRMVVGIENERARQIMEQIYRPLYLNRAPILFTHLRNAELIKYVSNAYLAMKITFINEIANLCEELGTDVQEIALGVGLDNRIGKKFLHAGPGYGGSCFPKDTQALLRMGHEAHVPLPLIEMVRGLNEERKNKMAERVVAACGGEVAGKKIAILGLSYKPNTDDIRDAPSLTMIENLQKLGARIEAYDPHAMKNAASVLKQVTFAPNPYLCAQGAVALVFMTEWDSFRALDLARLRTLLISPIIVDLRNIYHPKDMREKGFQYFSIGRK